MTGAAWGEAPIKAVEISIDGGGWMPVKINDQKKPTQYDLVDDQGTVVLHASADVTPEVKLRVIDYWTNVDVDLGTRVATGLGYRPGVRAA